mmetsp:Transcript_28953/g.48193  ORF Transcript_28953/g.48193 Transcript_28953/m.48193 type:complete len:468 (+) Transcript_28953:205-1608(+)
MRRPGRQRSGMSVEPEQIEMQHGEGTNDVEINVGRTNSAEDRHETDSLDNLVGMVDGHYKYQYEIGDDGFDDEQEQAHSETPAPSYPVEKTTSYGTYNDSLADKDSLALERDYGYTDYDDNDSEPIVLEHPLPDKEKRKRRRRTYSICLVGLLLVAAIVVATVLTTRNKTDEDRNASMHGSAVGSAESDNIFSSNLLPGAYYILETKVQNASALLDPDTPEGQAFLIVGTDEKISYDTAEDSAEALDMIQRYALLSMYFGTDGGAWTNNEGWSATRGDACSPWHGISCQDSIVTAIDLDENNVHGQIPEDFCLLTRVRSLVLSGNTQLQLPYCISELPSLEQLDLKGNGYSGRLPDAYHSMTSLKQLSLADNDFTGSLVELFPEPSNGRVVFPSLTTLDLANNDLSGEIPENALRRLRDLVSLKLSGNPNLTGSLNEACKGSLTYAEVDCTNVSCRCCQSGTNCPSS